MRCNKAQLADILNVSEVTLTAWQKEDPPLPITVAAARRGKANEYDTAAVIEWLVRRHVARLGVNTPKDQLLILQAEEAALRIAEKKGQLVNLAQLEPMLQRELQAFKAELEALADKVKDDIDALYGVEVDRELVAGHVRQALIHLSSFGAGTEGLKAAAAQAEDASLSTTPSTID